jgi:serine/threonine protein kinase
LTDTTLDPDEESAMAAPAAVHPSDQTLQSYGLGKLDDLLAEAVGKHLKECDPCRRRVAEVTSDSFVGRLRDAQARPESVPPVGSSLEGWSKLGEESRTPSPPPASTLPPGLAEHPDYQVLRELGRGGMGVVYLAENRMMGRKEVLKVVSSHLLNRKGVLERFLREIRSAAQLHHPNIITAYSATRVGESIVFSMQYVEGYDLSKLVEKSGPLSVAHACNFVYQAALGLQHAHEHGMVHRDIKPSNLMLARDGNKPVVKVLDFGLAKVTSEGTVDGGLTHEGQMLGTPHYIAPEQTVSAQKADIRADIYSLGCTLYCLLTGHPPFDAPSLYELLQAHHSMDAKPLNFIRPEVPAELAAVVAKMLAKEPERRFQTPSEVAEALKPFFKKDGVSSKVLKPEVSQVGLVNHVQEPAGVQTSATRPQPKANANPTPGQTAAGSRAEPKWESLIDIKETEDAENVVTVVPQPKRRWPRWFWPAIAGAFSFAMVALGFTIYVTTDYGRIKIIVDGPEPVVKVDDGKILIKTPRESISLRAGEHEFTVNWRDGQFKTDKFVVRRGEDEELRVEYEPRASDRLVTIRKRSQVLDFTGVTPRFRIVT